MPCLPFCANTTRGRTGQAVERDRRRPSSHERLPTRLSGYPGGSRESAVAPGRHGLLCVHGKASGRDLLREDAHPFEELFRRINDAD